MKYKLKKNLQIAIDGPVASGKSTIAQILSLKLGVLYVYTGAMYRAVGYLAKINNVGFKDEKRILALLKKTKIILKASKDDNIFCLVFLNGKQITNKIFTQEISWAASAVATLPLIRKELVKRQQEIAGKQSVIMEGRDITTRVLPEADLKIFMTADVAERAKRRLKQLEKRGVKIDYKNILSETEKRDYQDTHRNVDPLVLTKDSILIDTTKLTKNQVVGKILQTLGKKNLVK